MVKRINGRSRFKAPKATISDLQQNADLWYQIQVLLYDLTNLGCNHLSERRLSATTNELYISMPYFTDSEATTTRPTLVDNDLILEDTDIQGEIYCQGITPCQGLVTVENAIHQRLVDFFEKRKPSGDARPCGPHDMVPIYVGVFGIEKNVLREIPEPLTQVWCWRLHD